MKEMFPKVQDASLLLMRLSVAVIFFFAAYSKWGFLSAGAEGASSVMVGLLWFLTIVEPLGAIALITGFSTRWAAAGFALIMIGAILMLRFTMGAAFFTLPQASGLDYNVLIFVCCIVIFAFGAGRWSVDSLRKKL